MEWYASKNNNILGDAGQNNNGNKNNNNSNLGKNQDAEFKFHPEINRKSKILDQCLLNARENLQNNSMTNEKNHNNNS